MAAKGLLRLLPAFAIAKHFEQAPDTEVLVGQSFLVQAWIHYSGLNIKPKP